MATKFVELKEAAKMIDVTPEELVEMRSRGDIFGYRDGASWKFKLEEVERVIRERGAEARGGGDSAVLAAKDEEFDNLISGLSSKILAEKAQEETEGGSVLISEQELGMSATGQSTIIGKGLQPEQQAGDSDLRLADSSKDILGGGSDKLLEAPASTLEAASASDVLHGSDIKPSGGSGTGDMPRKTGSTGAFELGPELALSDEDDLEIGSDSALDDEIRPKTGSGKGSDVTLGTGDSGINLSPSDSGLSLEEEPLDLGGSGVEALELPEDVEVIAVESAADPDQATQVKADNEFLLSGGDMLEEDESSDSGSQVIALEDSESFDQDAATMLKAEQAAVVAEDFQPVVAEPGMAPAMATGQGVYVQPAVAVAPYSVWNVLSLGALVGMLALSGMMMVDVMLNMWSFNGTSSVSTGLADSILSVIGVTK